MLLRRADLLRLSVERVSRHCSVASHSVQLSRDMTGVPKVLEAPREHELDMSLVCASGNAQLPTLLMCYKNNLKYLAKKIIQSSVVMIAHKYK
jgi:hypothetical protein